MINEIRESQDLKVKFHIRGYDFEKQGETSGETDNNTDNQDLYSSKGHQRMPIDSLKSQ